MPPWSVAEQKPAGSAQGWSTGGAHESAALKVRGGRGSCSLMLTLWRGGGPEREPVLQAMRAGDQYLW
jgi:hypothetical protein